MQTFKSIIHVCSTQHLQSEVESYQERVSQLLVEKEKALSDLIAIRKINRNMEKLVMQ